MNMTEDAPLVMVFVSDLMFATKIENVVDHLGYQIRWVEKASEFGDEDEGGDEQPLGEQIYGQEGRLFREVATRQPALLVFDLGNEYIPWRHWIPLLKTAAATRSIPVLAYGPHVDTDSLDEAKRLGADSVLPRSRFAGQMLQQIQGHVRVAEREAIASACQEPLPELAIKGLERFNRGAYYKCHDDLEEAWRQEEGPGRELYRGVLQVAIAYYQIGRGNFRGATKMLLRMRQWLTPLPPVCQGVNVKKLLEDATAVQVALASLGPDQIDAFDFALLKPVEYKLP